MTTKKPIYIDYDVEYDKQLKKIKVLIKEIVNLKREIRRLKIERKARRLLKNA